MAPRERTAWPPTWESVKPKPRNALWINYARGCDAVALQGEQGELLKSPTSNDQRKILKSFNERLRRF